KAENPWWRKINDEIYGAKADQQGAIGGGKDYTRVVKTGEYIVRNVSELQHAIRSAKHGDVIFLPGDVHIDLTTHIYIDKLVLEIPAGVTLASDRGYNNSEGALITSDSLDTPVIFRALGAGIRFSGL